MLEPLISVIIPVYNAQAYLGRCIETAVSQAYQNLDIILIDDGSAGHCPEMCDAWVVELVRMGWSVRRGTSDPARRAWTAHK